MNSALESGNPLIVRLIDDYLTFKNRKKLNPSLARSEEDINRIMAHNFNLANNDETPRSILSHINRIAHLRSDLYPG